MGKGKKSFIDKKNAVTFHLVHRSQRDPLAADENAPQHVLMESKKDSHEKEEQKKYGIFFDDDYNYLQHLKEPSADEVIWEYVESPNQPKTRAERRKLQLPSSVFQSEIEEDEGLLNKAAPRPGPRPDLDPDIVAALDDDFDFSDPENELDDDFMTQAMGNEGDSGDEEYSDGDEERSDIDSDGQMFSDEEENEEELMDRLAPLMRKDRFNDEETKSRFTEYSMSSSVIRRNEQLSLLDDRFEAFYASYDDPELGPLDMEEIEGHWGQKHPLVLGCYKQLKNSGKMEEGYKKEWDAERIKRFENGTNSDDDMVDMEVSDDGDKQKKWDCESILSTYSNIYNHPKLISEPRRKKKNVIQIDPKTGIPLDTLNGGTDKLTVKALQKLDAETDAKECGTGPKSLCGKSVMSTLSVLSIRPKDETSEEKKERKKLLKEYRQERRVEKKANAEAFKEEKKRQVQIKINKQNNIQGKSIV